MSTSTNDSTGLHRPLQGPYVAADPTLSHPTERRIEQARHAAEATGRAYARENVAGAFELIRRPLPAATSLLVNRDSDEDGDTLILLLAVRGSDNRLLWCHDEYDHHPDADALPDDMEPDAYGDLIAEAEELLRAAYDQPGLPFAPADNDAYRGLSDHRGWNLLEIHLPAADGNSDLACSVMIEGTDDDAYRFSVTADDTVVMYVDGLPCVGVIGDSGVGWWPDREGDGWQPLTPGAKVSDRTLHVHDMSETQFYGISKRLRLPLGHFGQFKGDQGELRNITLDCGPWSCGELFDAALFYVQELGLAYDLIVETKYESRPAADVAVESVTD